jgi:hypothetical protein
MKFALLLLSFVALATAVPAFRGGEIFWSRANVTCNTIVATVVTAWNLNSLAPQDSFVLNWGDGSVSSIPIASTIQSVAVDQDGNPVVLRGKNRQ